MPCPVFVSIIEEHIYPGAFLAAPDGTSAVIYKLVEGTEVSYLSLSKLDELMRPAWSTEIHLPMGLVPAGLAFADGGSSVVVSWTATGSYWVESWIAKYSMYNGSESWSKRVGYWMTSSALTTSPDGTTIFAVGSDKTTNNPNIYIKAYDSLDGRSKWGRVYDGKGREWPGLYGASHDLASTILASEDGARVYVAAQVGGHLQESTDALVLALDARTGAYAWEFRHTPADNPLVLRFARSNGAYNLAELRGSNRIVVMTSTGIIALSAENGQQVWSQPWLGPGCPWNRPIYRPGICTILIDPHVNKLYAFTPSHLAAYSSVDGTLLWIIPEYDPFNDSTRPGHALLSADADFIQVVREARTPDPGTKGQDLVVAQFSTTNGRLEWSTRLDFGSYEYSGGVVQSKNQIHVLGYSILQQHHFIASYELKPNALES